jgi:ADP-ribosylation factor-like protein 3
VIDSTDKRRLEESGIELSNLLEQEKLHNVPLCIFANKQDLISALSPADISDALHLHNIRDRQWQIQACSAKNGTGLQEGIEWSIRTARK